MLTRFEFERRIRGLNQCELAEKLGVWSHAVSRVERGRMTLEQWPAEKRANAERFFGVAASELVKPMGGFIADLAGRGQDAAAAVNA